MRILQAMAGGKHGGAENFFLRLAQSFNKQDGVNQKVLVKTSSAWTAPLREAGVTTQELSFGGMLDFSTKKRFGMEINQFDPDVVLTWMNRATSYCPRQLSNQKFIHVARLGGYYDLKYYRHCDHLVGNTQDIVDYLVREGWPAERAHYLPNFVDAAPLPPASRAEQNTPDDAPLLVALGRLHTNKAFDVLIQAVAKVPGAHLWIAGEGPERNSLNKLAEQYGLQDRVHFLGWRSDAAALYTAADIFVCPSRHEPLGNVVIEGWAHRSPVIAADASGPKVLIENNINGLLVPMEDTQAMAQAIQRLIDEPATRTALAEAGFQAYQASFTEDVVTRQYLEFFNCLTELN
jgi:glycosyltransferase involved in cell wall biosynthesis